MKGHWDGQVWSKNMCRGTEETGSVQPGKETPFCKDLTAIYTKVVRGYRQEGDGCFLEVHGGKRQRTQIRIR